MTNKYEIQFNEMLEGKEFEGEKALDYLSKNTFKDDDLEAMSKSELIQLFTKAYVTLCLEIRERNLALNKILDLSRKINKDKRDSALQAEINLLIAEIMSSQKMIISQIVKAIPEIKKRAYVKNPTEGGIERSKRSLKCQRMNEIAKDYLEEVARGYNFEIAGRLTEFYERKYREQDQADQASFVKQESIKRRIEKERKKLNKIGL